MSVTTCTAPLHEKMQGRIGSDLGSAQNVALCFHDLLYALGPQKDEESVHHWPATAVCAVICKVHCNNTCNETQYLVRKGQDLYGELHRNVQPGQLGPHCRA